MERIGYNFVVRHSSYRFAFFFKDKLYNKRKQKKMHLIFTEQMSGVKVAFKERTGCNI